MSRRTLINLVFFNGVFVLMLVWAANNIITIDAIERPYTITGDFAQASGVMGNAEVTYLGVHYGVVSDVDRTDDGVRVTMKIDRGKELPDGAIARVFRKSAIGEPYIDFIPPPDYSRSESGRIEEGDHIPLERTTVPLEFSELLRSASALVSSIEPEQVGSLIHELALALDGRGDSLRTLTTSIDRLTATFVERTDQLDRLAENNTRLTSALADHRLSLGRSIQNLRSVAETLRQADGDTRALLDVGPDFLGATADLVADQKRNLDCLLTDLAPVLRALAAADPLQDLAETLDKGPLAFGYAAAAVDQEPDGAWVRINLMVPLDGENADAYVPPKSLPVVPSVPACASTLTPAVPTSFSPSGPVSPGQQPPSTDSATSTAPAGDSEDTAAAPETKGPAGLASTGGVVAAVVAAVLLLVAAGTWYLRRPGTQSNGPSS